MIGVGVLLCELGGNAETVAALTWARGKHIARLAIVDNALRLDLVGMGEERTLTIHDAGQSCCEARYMSTDDDLAPFVGAEFLGAETRDAPNVEGEEDHEVQFLVVHTSLGDFTCANHNEHNGYYGGFSIAAALHEPTVTAADAAGSALR